MIKPLYYTRCPSAHYILRLPVTNSLDMQGKKTICPSCEMEVTIGEAHPLVPVYSKPKFYRRKDLSGISETVDEYGWTSDAVLDAPTELKYDGIDIGKDKEPEPMDTELTGQTIINKKDKHYYDRLVFDIQQDGDRVIGTVWLKWIELYVYQTAPNTWREYKRSRVRQNNGELMWYVLESELGERKLTCIRDGVDPLLGQSDVWYVLYGWYESEWEADLMKNISKE